MKVRTNKTQLIDFFNNNYSYLYKTYFFLEFVVAAFDPHVFDEYVYLNYIADVIYNYKIGMGTLVLSHIHTFDADVNF